MLQLKPDKVYYVFTVETIERKTEKALLLQIQGQRFWIPKSQLLGWNDGVNKRVALTWFIADSNGLLNKNWNGSDAYDYTAFTGKMLHEYLTKHGLQL